VPRPASTQLTNFTGFTTPARAKRLCVIGSRAYGMIASARFAGKSEPFCYDLAAGAFVAITGPTAANCPTSQATSGDWTPADDGDDRRAHHDHPPGYDGHTLRRLDRHAGSRRPITGTTHTSTLIDTLSTTRSLAGVAGRRHRQPAPASSPEHHRRLLTATSVTLSVAATVTAAGVGLTFTSGTRAAPVYNSGQDEHRGFWPRADRGGPVQRARVVRGGQHVQFSDA
jgi:hypothetical protein